VTQPPWRFRRRAIFGSMGAAFVIIGYVMVRWDDTSLAQTLALGAFGLIGTVVAAYVGGAAYEDVRLWRNGQETDGEDSGQ
jgi:multisubunit Na+/H+ antiporter MnhG subunit